MTINSNSMLDAVSFLPALQYSFRLLFSHKIRLLPVMSSLPNEVFHRFCTGMSYLKFSCLSLWSIQKSVSSGSSFLLFCMSLRHAQGNLCLTSPGGACSIGGLIVASPLGGGSRSGSSQGFSMHWRADQNMPRTRVLRAKARAPTIIKTEAGTVSCVSRLVESATGRSTNLKFPTQ